MTLITLPPYDTANTERVRVGVGSKLGLPAKLSRNTVLAAFLGGAREGTAPTVAVSSAALESNTVTLDSALNGVAVIIDFYETLWDAIGAPHHPRQPARSQCDAARP